MRFQLVHEIFEAEADLHPDSVAVEFEGEEVSYSELDQRANRLARHLRSRGVGRGSLVAILLQRSVEVYVAILAVLKAGAAYVPLDPEYPGDRVSYILENSGASAVITVDDMASSQTGYSGFTVRLDADASDIDRESARRLGRGEVGVRSDDLCYVIYTSGSTGRPKGVQIEHRSLCNLIDAEHDAYGVRKEDRVCQTASVSFDLSVEEIWLAFSTGATLVAISQDTARSGSDLCRAMAERRVTVLSCVPTLLSMLTEDVKSLRVIILGGEAAPEWLVSRWARPGRRIINTYGPTETTVIATCSDLSVGRPVTLGTPIHGYRVYILDDSLEPVAPGSAGEICIGGPGVARGYVGLPAETSARFLRDPFASSSEDAVMFRTGDVGRINPEGELEFLGRRDGQVKLRGYRIELTEVESVMMEHAGVLAAACTIREDVRGVQQLVGYIVPRGRAAVSSEQLRMALRRRLPSFMVPAVIETLEELPRLPSGKLDRGSLPPPMRRRGTQPEAKPANEAERQILQVWCALFDPLPVTTRNDFFLDLGGHSLLAARMVSELRRRPEFAGVSVADVYEHPTVAGLAAALSSREPGRESPPLRRTGGPQRKRPGTKTATLLQTLGLYFSFGFRALEWVTPYAVFLIMYLTGHPLLVSLAWSLLSAVGIFPVLLLAGIGAKWLLLGRVQSGRHPLWGGYYLRWWFVQSLLGAVPLDYLEGTPLLPSVYRLLGSKMGRGVHLDSANIAAYDLVSVGDGSSVDEDASLLGYKVEQGELILGPVDIGRFCYVGTRSVLLGGTSMGDGSRVEDLSLLPSGTHVPAGETWTGSPARRSEGPVPDPARPLSRGPVWNVGISLLYAGLVLALPLLVLLAFVPGVLFLFSINAGSQPLVYLAAVPIVGGSFVFLLMSELVVAKWILVGRVKPGTYPVHGGFYVRNWVVDQLHALSLDLVAPIHATLYLSPWYKALGAKIGRNVELSTATSTTPDQLSLDDGATVADEVSLGSARVEGGWMTVAPTHIGRRSFVGNSAVVPAGTSTGDGTLIGVLSVPPTSQKASEPRASWLGSPPITLPRRQPSARFPAESTFAPTRRKRLVRGAVESMRVTLPPAGFIVVTTSVLGATVMLWGWLGLTAALLLMPVVYAAACLGVGAVTAAAKWAIVGRYRPFERPLWSTFVWRLEFVNALYEFLATPLLLEPLQGTPFLPAYLRVLGAKIGRGVYVHTTGFLEWDLVMVGDRAALNEDCVLQTHLFEDRVLKAAPVDVGPFCDVGAYSVVLYDSRMEAGSQLDALSLLMKGEVLPTGTMWAGIPARLKGEEIEVVERAS